jgi:hypothetical protein
LRAGLVAASALAGVEIVVSVIEGAVTGVYPAGH